ncbi:PREDICTED: osmotin-like protein OSM34, partial [Populus euphratica]|uniref:Osmotin-like protein OSM34 n=1 Tax=Populus euphratica TaxID=75702 RepID=A0AAJ6TKY1_POPEU
MNQFNNLDFFDISLVDGFNVPMVVSPVSGNCRGIKCAADINGQCPLSSGPQEVATINGQCPNELRVRAPGGCNNPCTVPVVNTVAILAIVVQQDFSRFLKQRCPDA